MKTLKEQLIEAIEEINHELNMHGHYYEELYNTSDTYAVRYFNKEINDILEELGDEDSSIPLEYLLTLNDIDLYEMIVYKRIAISAWRELNEEGIYVDAEKYFETVEMLIKENKKQGASYSYFETKLFDIFFED